MYKCDQMGETIGNCTLTMAIRKLVYCHFSRECIMYICEKY